VVGLALGHVNPWCGGMEIAVLAVAVAVAVAVAMRPMPLWGRVGAHFVHFQE
jgi:hypothetical protein